jgi:hypothetical protein
MLTSTGLFAQHNSDSISSTVNYAENTFLTSRVINGQSSDCLPQKQLALRVEHRFGLLNSGFSQFYGLDQATTFFDLEYGITDWLMVGLNRTSTDKTVSGFAKVGLFRQSTGARNMPFSVALMFQTSVIGINTDTVLNNDFNSRLNYMYQVVIARKFSDNFSAQIAPALIHRNLVPTGTDKNDLLMLGLGAKYKITSNMSLSGEYYPVISPSKYFKKNYSNSLSFSLDIETAGHVFQLILSNSAYMLEKNFVGETSGNWLKGDVRFGFNILRKFDL